tara:strand:+ start:273 stop:497 length:225 start_codon:yes stop_codon:yes gene_type:complete
MPDLRIKSNQDNGDLPKQLELDFDLKDYFLNPIDPITFGDQSIKFNEWLSFVKSTRDKLFVEMTEELDKLLKNK